MIIYLEGPDGSGKTSLANEIRDIARAMDYTVYFSESSVSTRPTDKGRVDKDFLKRRMEFMFDSEALHILDRGPISDCIYRMFDEYEPVMEFPEFYKLLKCYHNKLMLIYCNNKKAEEYMRKRGDDNPVALAKHHKICQAYDMVFSDSRHIKIHSYDFTNVLSRIDIRTAIKQKLNDWQD